MIIQRQNGYKTLCLCAANFAISMMYVHGRFNARCVAQQPSFVCHDMIPPNHTPPSGVREYPAEKPNQCMCFSWGRTEDPYLLKGSRFMQNWVITRNIYTSLITRLVWEDGDLGRSHTGCLLGGRAWGGTLRGSWGSLVCPGVPSQPDPQ